MAQALSAALRGSLKTAVLKGREIAQQAAEGALAPYGVGKSKAPDHLDEQGRAVRNRLRAHARQLGDDLVASTAGAPRLEAEVAYEVWHRILFTRFLVENELLIHPEYETPLSLDFLQELAQDDGKDPWELAAEFAGRMLPEIFRGDDPTQQLKFPRNEVQKLERLVLGLDSAVFKASDSLGWSYQFWQTQLRETIDNSSVKVGKDEIAAATQLFTDDYMVEFLLQNTLGTWWAANHPDKPLPVDMPYLRLPADGGNAQGAAFNGWPESLSELKTLDPSCGSGHFPVFLLHLLVPMRMALEGLSAAEAVDAVLRQNIHALEIDPRCVEIAVFALKLAAWTYPGAGGYRPLPVPNVACSGLPIAQQESEWLALANGDSQLREGMRALFRAFKDAPLLGSLVDPRSAGGDLVSANFEELLPLLNAALAKERIRASDEATEAVSTARDLVTAAALLAGRYHLVATNVPYLKRGEQVEELKQYCDQHYPVAKPDLATVFIERCHALCAEQGVMCLVSPQNWWFLKSYTEFRRWFLRNTTVRWAVALGEEAWESFGNRGPLATLLIAERAAPSEEHVFEALDVVKVPVLADKKTALVSQQVLSLSQSTQLENPDARLALTERSTLPLLRTYAQSFQGVISGDGPRFMMCMWELPGLPPGWLPLQSTVSSIREFGGLSSYLRWGTSGENLARKQGLAAWGQSGVAGSQMRTLPAALYLGGAFDSNVAPIIPSNPGDLAALWCFCASGEYQREVRVIDSGPKVTNATLVKVPIDLERWREVAREKYPNGLPRPYTNDPTQWLFHGHPCGMVGWSERNKCLKDAGLREDATVLQVAVARLLGYRWPAELITDMPMADEQRAWVTRSGELAPLADDDGIVCLPPVNGERAAADRLLDLLAAAYGTAWKDSLADKLLADAGHAGKTLDEWLRAGFFSQHCKLFESRPFIWHVWDGEENGFAALLNYHRLDKARLTSLTFTYLGGWIDEQRRQQAAGISGARQLVDAAVALQDKLKKVLEGEKPCDIFVRWKSLAQQPLGWNPDLEDGVRVNIRPFIMAGDVGRKGAGILRDLPGLDWSPDRGDDSVSSPWYELGPLYGENKGKRINAHHTTLLQKQAARGTTP